MSVLDLARPEIRAMQPYSSARMEASGGEVLLNANESAWAPVGDDGLGCNRYPDCAFVAWGKPVDEKCPDCGSSYLVEKWLKAGPVYQCPNKECKFKKEAPPPPVEAKPAPAATTVS